MATRTLTTIRNEAKTLVEENITSKAKLLAALPTLIELADAVKAAKRGYDAAREVLEQLNDACADYALAHNGVFDEGISTSPKGVKSGDITIEAVTYHLASGFASPKRIDGECLTQEFLAALPQDWAKASWSLDTTGINRLGLNDAQLEEQGLFRPAKNTWSAGVAV